MEKKDFKPVITEKPKVRRHIVYAALCKGCRICIEVCPQKAIGIHPTIRGVYNNQIAQCDIEKCTACGICQQRCPDCAIKVENLALNK